MSGTASNYNLFRLYAGIVIASLATLAALLVSGKPVLRMKSTGLWMTSITIAYGVMMFASSYVEEEQQFWYWATSSWLAWLSLKALVYYQILQVNFETHGCSCRNTTRDVLPSVSAIMVLTLMRVARRWNQTGQKHAGEPDIARTILPVHNQVLWLLVLATYFNITQRLARKVLPTTSRHVSAAFSIALCVAALGFKIVFTKAEAPELLIGLHTDFLRPMWETSLVFQSRVVFVGIGSLVFLTILLQASGMPREEKAEGSLYRCRMTAKY